MRLDTTAMESSKFCKLLREAGLFTPKLRLPDVEAIILKISGASRKFNYDQFLDALCMVAEKKVGPS